MRAINGNTLIEMARMLPYRPTDRLIDILTLVELLAEMGTNLREEERK